MKMVLLPGLDGTGMLFLPFLRELPPELEPLVVSYPGDRICSAQELVSLVLSMLPKEEPYILVAESFSGPIGLKVSALHARTPDALILCASFAKCPLPKKMMGILGVFGGVAFRIRPPLWFVRRYMAGAAAPEVVSLFYEAKTFVHPQVMASRLKVMGEFDENFVPRHLDFPMLYIQATADRVVGKQNFEQVKKLSPKVLLERMDSAHLVLQTHPRECVGLILKFLSSAGVKI